MGNRVHTILGNDRDTLHIATLYLVFGTCFQNGRSLGRRPQTISKTSYRIVVCSVLLLFPGAVITVVGTEVRPLGGPFP